MIHTHALRRTATSLAGLLLLAGCAAVGQSENEDAVVITGSATIRPIALIASRESDVDTSLEAIGSVEGFERFCSGGADINNSSVPITDVPAGTDVQQLCADNDVEYVEVPIGVDAVAVIRNDSNDAVTDITLDELARIWGPDAAALSWSDVRSEWPEEEFVLYGRDEGSGTYQVFAEELLGVEGELRPDVEHTDDLHQLAGWVAEESHALAFMGIGNYLSAPEEDRNRITTVTIDGVAPDAVSALDRSYPLARPLYLYVSVASLEENPRVEEYLSFLLDNGRTIVPRAFFYPLDESAYDRAAERLSDRVTGPADGR